MVDGDELAEAAGQAFGLDRRHVAVAREAWAHDHLSVLGTLFLGQQGDEGSLEGRLAGLRKELGDLPGGNHPAVIHGREPVEAFRLVHVGSGHDDAHLRPPGPNGVDQVPELTAR